MTALRLLLAGLAISVLAPLTATAGRPPVTLDFSYVGTGPNTGEWATWSQSSQPTPDYSIPDDDTTVPVTNGSYSSHILLSAVDYFAYSAGVEYGGFDVEPGEDVSDAGVQLFTGTEAAPVFAVGVYDLDNGVLTVTASEPLAWTLLTLGFGGVGMMLRARRKLALAQL